MYYTIISKTPLINKNLSRDEKMFRTLVVGSICYVITHAILFSPKFSNQVIEKYRNYIYYVWGADLSIAFVMTKFMGNDAIPIDMNINSYAEDDSETHNEQNLEQTLDNQKFQLETNGEKLTREEILEKFYKKKEIPLQETKSPFIKTKKELKELKELKEPEEEKLEAKVINKENNSDKSKQNLNQNINQSKEIHVSTEEKISEPNISDTEIKTYKGKINQNINQNISLSA